MSKKPSASLVLLHLEVVEEHFPQSVAAGQHVPVPAQDLNKKAGRKSSRASRVTPEITMRFGHQPVGISDSAGPAFSRTSVLSGHPQFNKCLGRLFRLCIWQALLGGSFVRRYTYMWSDFIKEFRPCRSYKVGHARLALLETPRPCRNRDAIISAYV